jgi:hypothetical protein
MRRPASAERARGCGTVQDDGDAQESEDQLATSQCLVGMTKSNGSYSILELWKSIRT